MSVQKALAAAMFAVVLGASLPAGAASTGAGARDRDESESAETKDGGTEFDELYARGMELAEAGKYKDALQRFEQAHKKDRKSAEALNMVAFCQRKTGDLEHAFENYAKALDLKPDFPQCREYLAEAHLQAFLLQVETLRGYGAEGQKELAQVQAAVKMAAQQAHTGEAPVNSADW